MKNKEKYDLNTIDYYVQDENTINIYDYSGLLGATCPDFESHHSAE